MGNEPKKVVKDTNATKEVANKVETPVVEKVAEPVEATKEAPKKEVQSVDVVAKAMQEEAQKDHVPGIATVTLLHGTEATPEEVVIFSKLRENLGVTPGKLKEIILDKDLVSDYNLSKDDVKLITKVLAGIEKDKISHLDVTDVTDEIRVIMQKYGITLGTLKDPEELKKLVTNAKELKAMNEFYEGIIYN